MTKDTRASEQRSIQPAHECIVVPVIYSVNPFFSGLKSDLFIPSPAAVVGGRPIKVAAVEWLKDNRYPVPFCGFHNQINIAIPLVSREVILGIFGLFLA